MSSYLPNIFFEISEFSTECYDLENEIDNSFDNTGVPL